MINAADILQAVLTAAGAWLAVRVELRWLRSDVNRAHKRLDVHDDRVRNLEINRS